MINLNERDDVVVVMGKLIKERAQRREFETMVRKIRRFRELLWL
jgi:hypothetical protein